MEATEEPSVDFCAEGIVPLGGGGGRVMDIAELIDAFFQEGAVVFDSAAYGLYLLSVMVGPIVAVFLNVVMAFVEMFVPVEGEFVFDIVPLVE